MNFFHIQTARR